MMRVRLSELRRIIREAVAAERDSSTNSPPLVRLFTDPDYHGAEVDEEGVLGLPVTSISVDKIDLFEPADKLRTPAGRANIRGMRGRLDALPPILVRSMPGGRFQVLDGHHRYAAAVEAGLPTIRARIVPPDRIEEI